MKANMQMGLHTSIEIMPGQLAAFMEDLALRQTLDHMPQNQHRVYVTHINGQPYSRVCDCCEQLAAKGISVIPHLAARNLTEADNPEEIVDRFNRANITGILLLGGDSPNPEKYQSVYDLLTTGNLVERLETTQLHIAAFPDGHAHVDSVAALDHLKQKCDWAIQHRRTPYLLTQISFSSDSVIAFIRQLRKSGINTPVIAGCMGPVSLSRMITLASRMKLHQVTSVAGKLYPGRLMITYRLRKFIQALQAEDTTHGFHIFPFGNYAASLAILNDLQQAVVKNR